MAENNFDFKKWFDKEVESLEQDAEYISYGLMIDLASQIASKLDKEGLKQKDLADRLGKSPGWISRIINNPTNFSVKKLVELGAALGLELEINFKESKTNHEFKPKTVPGKPKATPSKQLSFGNDSFQAESEKGISQDSKGDEIAA